MRKEIICENTSIDLAILDGLKALCVSYDDVSIEVIQYPKKGIFRIGAKLAKVKIAIKLDNDIIDNHLEKQTLNSVLVETDIDLNSSPDNILDLEATLSNNALDTSVEKIVSTDNDFILKGLNECQIEAVVSTEGYIRVIAGAGSGKTKALTHRYAHLVQDLGIMPANILCVTFTNKASNEMKKRIRKMIGESDLGKIATFHGFCVQLLREDCNIIQYPSRFIILDEDDVDIALKECFEKLHLSSRDYTFRQAKQDIHDLKDRTEYIELLCDPNMTLLQEKRTSVGTLAEKVFYEFLHIQRKTFGMDFNDLINFALYILSKDEPVRNKWQKRLQYIMVDEFQDVNIKQYKLVSILSDYHKNLFIVGDPDQTIYSWRGANVGFILNFDKAFENTKTIMMNDNYRSLPEVIKASNSLIDKNKNRIKKALVPLRKGKGSSIYFHAKTQYDEALWIANQISSLIEQGVKYSHIAILYRAHYVSRPVEEKLVQAKVPYVLYSGVGFYRRKEIKDILCYFRMITNADDVAFLRVINEPKRGIGKKRVEFIKEYAESNNCSFYQSLQENLEHPLLAKTEVIEFIETIEYFKKSYKTITITEVLNEILDKTKYEELLRKSGEDERLDNIAELKQAIYDFEVTAGEDVTLEDYLEHISLFTNIDKDENTDTVKMMTVHTAKGLEFPYVFVYALCEGIFPSKKTDTSEKMEEERRLAYVAFTRAENKLFVSDSEGINYDGSFRYPSRFIFNCEKVHLDYIVELPEHLRDDAENIITQSENSFENISTLVKGSKVKHSIFGIGEIIEINIIDKCYIIKFDDMETPRNIAFSANLK
ncbi:MAG: UvrD-helicase domain-containing protein [Clostridia bacterium]